MNQDAERQPGVLVEPEGVPVPHNGCTQRDGERHEQRPIAQRGRSLPVPGGGRNRGEHHERRNLGQTGESRRGAAQPERAPAPGPCVADEGKHARDPEKHHHRVRHEGASEEHCGRRHGEEQRGRQCAGRAEQLGRQGVDHHNRRRREQHRHDAAEVFLRSEEIVERGDHRRENRELHLHVRVAAAPVDLRVERVDALFVEGPRNRRGVDLAPAVRVDEGRADPLQAQARAERDDEEQRQELAPEHLSRVRTPASRLHRRQSPPADP